MITLIKIIDDSKYRKWYWNISELKRKESEIIYSIRKEEEEEESQKRSEAENTRMIKRDPLCISLNNILRETDTKRIPILRLFTLVRTPPFVISSSQP